MTSTRVVGFDNCVDYSMASWSGAEVMIKLVDTSSSTLYQSYGTRNNNWTYNQITSTASTGNQYYSQDHDNLVSLANGDTLFVSGRNAENSGWGGSMGNGYLVAVYPSSPDYTFNLKMIVAPYTQEVGTSYDGPRQFSGWTTSHEISYNGSLFNTSSSTPSQLGTFTFFIR